MKLRKFRFECLYCGSVWYSYHESREYALDWARCQSWCTLGEGVRHLAPFGLAHMVDIEEVDEGLTHPESYDTLPE